MKRRSKKGKRKKDVRGRGKAITAVAVLAVAIEKRGGRIQEKEKEKENINPPLLACRGLMNANHDPEAARSTCCFPVQIAYNFYCHGEK